MYHGSAFARERDKIRQSVLESIGWTISRNWSTDWWTNREGAIKNVDDRLRQRLDEDRREQVEQEDVGASDEDIGTEPEADDVDVPEPAPEGIGGTEPHSGADRGPDLSTHEEERAGLRQPRYDCTSRSTMAGNVTA